MACVTCQLWLVVMCLFGRDSYIVRHFMNDHKVMYAVPKHQTPCYFACM